VEKWYFGQNGRFTAYLLNMIIRRPRIASYWNESQSQDIASFHAVIQKTISNIPVSSFIQLITGTLQIQNTYMAFCKDPTPDRLYQQLAEIIILHTCRLVLISLVRTINYA
jgi:hypothetical protein